MKEDLIKIVNTVYNEEYFKNKIFSLTINYIKVIEDFRYKKLNEENYQFIIDNIKSTELITSFNITVMIERGVDHLGNYSDDWKSVNFTFHGSKKTGLFFEFNTLGARESFRISQFLIKTIYNDKDPERPFIKHENKFDINNIDKILSLLIELDILIDKQFEEKNIIFDKLKMK